MTFQLGVCYYPEHWPEERWPVDAKMMAEGGLSIVRIGEFAWAQMEPSEGVFTWDWLDRAIETLAAQNLQIVLGTPTAAPPAWLARAYPEILPVDVHGRVRRFGSRRNVCANSPAYRRHTGRIVTALAQRYGSHPALIGWQIDNEFGCHDTARCYCPRCAEAFKAWLQARYGTLEALNEAWGTVFWSQRYGDWAEIDPPILAVTEQNASQVLDYYRFSSDSWVNYEQYQVDLLRRHSPGKPITHNFMGDFPDLDYYDLAQPLDFAAWDSYPTGYVEMMAPQHYLPDEPRPALACDVGDPYVTGFCHDLTRGLKDKAFWVIEQQCGNVNWANYNTGVRPGIVRLWTWHTLAAGAEAVVYFRWRACRFAQEQMHSGLLHHDASPAAGYGDVLVMADERALMEAIASEPYQAEAAVLMDYSDLWALQLQPHRRDFAYQRHQFRFYQALQRLGIQTDVIAPQADLSRYKLVLAPTAFLADPRLAETLHAYVAGGGALLLGVRSGFKTTSNLVTDLPLPGLLREMVGTTISDWHALPPGVNYDVDLSGDELKAGVWAEALAPDPDVDVLASYTSGPFSARAALTEHRVGDGRAYYLGWYPTAEHAETIVARLADKAGLWRLGQRLPDGLVMIRRGSHVILLNFAEQPQVITVAGRSIAVGPRDVIVSDFTD